MTEEIIRQFSIAARYGKQEEGGHLPRVRAAKAARACVVFDRLGPFGFVLYFLIIVGAIVALVHVTSRVADYAIASRAREASAATRTSRVAVGLEAQQRAAGWQPSGSVPERPTEPDVSATELAKGIDDAENHPLPSNANSNEPTGPRVEGWSKRMDLKKPASIVDEIGHIILRSLRSEM